MARSADPLDGYERSHVYEDGTVLRVSIRRTTDEAYPSGWRYTLHYGALTPGPDTLDDGTIRRYDNAHEATKGHELHAAPESRPATDRVSRDSGPLRAVLGRDSETTGRAIRHRHHRGRPMTDATHVLVVTIGDGEEIYEEGRTAIQTLNDGQPVEQSAMVTFANEEQLSDVFNERTYTLLRVIRADAPASIRETARLVDRDVKNVHQELATLEALGIIRFEDEGQAKRPVFPYDDLIIRPFTPDSSDAATAPT